MASALRRVILALLDEGVTITLHWRCGHAEDIKHALSYWREQAKHYGSNNLAMKGDCGNCDKKNRRSTSSDIKGVYNAFLAECERICKTL